MPTPPAGAASWRRPPSPGAALAGLCLLEFLSWGILYYSLPVGATRITADASWPPALVPGVYAASLLCAAAAGPRAGRLIDALGPRPVMAVGALTGAAGMALSAATTSVPVFVLAWLLVGAAQAGTLYPPAFAAASQWFPGRGAWPLTAITLAGGVSSTAFAPLIALLIDGLGWRPAFALLALAYGLVATPAALLLLTPRWERPVRTGPDGRDLLAAITRSRPFRNAQIGLAVAGAGLYAVTLNHIPLLEEVGFDYRDAAIVFGLVGAGQLLGRLAFLPLSTRGTPRLRTLVQVALTALVLVTVAVVSAPPALVVLGAVLAGAVRGTHTLSVATAVSDRWGSAAYATIFGRFNLPIAGAIAVSPLLGEVLASGLGSYRATALLFAALALLATAAARRS